MRFATRRYCDNPLIVQGPGAGPEVTAGGVFADLLRCAPISAPRSETGAYERARDGLRAGHASATSASASTSSATRSRALGDRVTRAARREPGVRIELDHAASRTDLPLEAERNTAGRRCSALLAGLRRRPVGVELEIEKGIPLGSGLGGSAASAVAAVVAANALLETPLRDARAAQVRAAGEAVASGAMHGDNVAPSLFGGLVLTVGIDHPRIKRIPVPPAIRCVLVHPHMFLSTREARGILSRTVEPVGLRLADREPRRLHRRLLHERSAT